MGDRANLYFRTAHNAGIGVYAHSSGPDGIAEAAMAVLENKAFLARIGDSHYATRIGIQTALESLGAVSNDQYGFGLWTPEMGMADNSYGICVIDVTDGAVYVTGKKAWNFEDNTKPDALFAPTADRLNQAMQQTVM